MVTTKAIIDVQNGKLELEGSEQFVTHYLDKYAPLIEQLRMGTSAKENKTRPIREAKSPNDGAQEPRKTGTSKKIGPSCGVRLRDLKDEGFFKERRRINDVKEKLEQLATPYERKHVAAALNHAIKTAILRRLKDGGQWVYINP